MGVKSMVHPCVILAKEKYNHREIATFFRAEEKIGRRFNEQVVFVQWKMALFRQKLNGFQFAS